MESLTIPPNPNWFMQSACYSTPDNGLLYGAMSKIVYIPPKSENADTQIKVIDLFNKLCSFSVHPEWKDSKRFAVINSDLHVLIYDFESGEPVKGHKGHESAGQHSMNNLQSPTAIAFLKQNTVLSSVSSNVIQFSLPTNTYKVFMDLSSRNPILIMKQSPKDLNLVAAGTKNGLILLLAVDKMEVVARFRGHDAEISSLDWMYLSMKQSAEVSKSADRKSSLENLIASTDTSDIFDIYDVENGEPEFGVYGGEAENCSDDEESNVAELQEKIVSNSNFNYLEACRDLKTVMLSDENANGDSSKGTYDDNKDQYGMKNDVNPSCDESLASNASSRTPVLTEESLNYLDECQRMKDFLTAPKEEIAQLDEVAVLASGSREATVWLWDIKEGAAFGKIQWHPKTRPALPSPFTNVLWVDQSTLLITDGNGDLNEHKVHLDAKTRVLTSKEQKEKKFDAKGVLNMSKSDDGSVIWTSSIHRHISCLDVKKDYEKVVSLDTIQLRVHFIVENPIDSNVIAIGGNDKRICLWNTSEASSQTISLRPLMNKIHSCVLCLAWHPEKDNLLAFSTREGRIGVLDVNKSSNVPTILSTFSSQEVYSIAWAKLKTIDGEVMVLIACNSKKLVYYNQKDQWKMTTVEHLKSSASVAVSGNILAVGFGNGDLQIVDIANNFRVVTTKKVSRKYIGMMSWHNEMLAVSSESGITLIKQVDCASDFPDERLLKLQGHKGRVFSVRFNRSGSLLVSCCVSGYVKVWDLETLSAVSSFSIDTSAYSSIFLPSNEDFIVCGGQDSTVLTEEWRKHPAEQEAEEVVVKKKHNKNIQWAAPTEVITILKNSQRRHKKKVVKSVDDSMSELSSEIVKMNLLPKKISSIFVLANREITSHPLEFIERLLTDGDRDLSCSEMIFGSRENVKDVIAKELEESKPPNLKNHCDLIFHQLGDTLKSDLLDRIAKKTLTSTHVVTAPSVSFDLWRKCCVAFGTQCIENDDSLAAVPYFLAVNDIDNCVNHLCDGKHFCEAWVIAKMRKQDSDPIFENIIQKWVAYFNYSGNYEAAAALFICKKEFKKAAEMLGKRQNKNEKCEHMLEILSNKAG